MAQFNSLKKKKKAATENNEATDNPEDKSEETKDPKESTDFFADIDAKDNHREREKINFGNIYDFRSEVSLDTIVYKSNSKTNLTSNKNNVERISKIKKDFPNLKYRRSSLYTLMVHDTTRTHWNIIARTFGNYLMPIKFNDHNVGSYLIDARKGMEKYKNEEAGKLQGKHKKKEKKNNTKAAVGEEEEKKEGDGDKKNPKGDEKAKTKVRDKIDQYLKENDVAKKLVAKWFNRGANGGFDMGLIAERGYYNASDLDVKLARSSQRGEALLADAGEELLVNTFVVINDYQFLSVAEATEMLANPLGGKNKKKNKFNLKVIVLNKVLQGYAILTNSHLYRLSWNDSIATVFYNQYWTEGGNIDQARKEAFENSSIFKFEKVGVQSAFEAVSSLLGSKSYPELIEIATRKATDKAMAKLQRNYPEFQTKTPLYDIDPLIAKVGVKEGVSPKDKFEVLEQILEEGGRTRYKRMAILSVDETKIWDNTYMANMASEEAEANGDAPQTIKATHFKGNADGLYSGMLIRHIR